ncbi:AAA family ATPase [Nocardia bhagyanarayanae]|uniref:MinD-like ATPase involved in chromosome partitioning or flagellar assembly n=1 Tax=Nocardia bhagyanarayanae TaxID=1215925 RepID=A0A543F4I2_9NOCA|nr:AAA family ATPase [Nocardia bhagyanarayanae]TQM28739.1 MinD-like ATPase involved in chromosome partitioning or flagellar assembly [Nocardia bhagyanarayanae]
MSRNNDGLPMLPPWLSDSEVNGGYEAPVQNLPHDDIIDDAPDRKRTRRKSQAPEGRHDSSQGSGRKDKKRRWLGRDKDEPVEEQPAEPQPRADSWGRPQSGDSWSSGPDAEGRPGQSPQQGTRGEDRNGSWQPTEGPGRQSTGGQGIAPQQPMEGRGPVPPQSGGGYVPQQFGGQGQPGQEPIGEAGRWSGGPEQAPPGQFGVPGQASPQQFGGPGPQHGGPEQTYQPPTGGPGFPSPVGGPGQPPIGSHGQVPTPQYGGPGQIHGASAYAPGSTGGPGQQQHPTGPGHAPVDGSSQATESPDARRTGQSRLPTRQPSQPSEGFQPLGQRTPTPTTPPPAPEPPPSNEATTRYQRQLPDLPPPPSDVRPSPAEDSSARRAQDDFAPRTAEDQSAAGRTPAPDAEHRVSPPAAESHNAAQTSQGHGFAPTAEGRTPAQTDEGHGAAPVADDRTAAQTGQRQGTSPTAETSTAAQAGQAHNPAPADESRTATQTGQGHGFAPTAEGRTPAQTGEGHGPASTADDRTAAQAGQGHGTSPTAETSTAAQAGQGHNPAPAGGGNEFDSAPPWLAGPGATATSSAAAARPAGQDLPPQTQEGSAPSGDAPPSWLGGAEQGQSSTRPELPPPPTASAQQPWVQATSSTAQQSPATSPETGRPEPAPAMHADVPGGTSAAIDPATGAARPVTAPRSTGDDTAFDATRGSSTRPGGEIPQGPADSTYGPATVGRGHGGEFTRNPAAGVGAAEDADVAGGRHRLPAEPDPGERQWGAPGPAQGGHRAPVSDQPAPGEVRRDPGVFAQQGGQAPGGEMPWSQSGYGPQAPNPQDGPAPYGYADPRQGGYAPAPGPDASAYHIPGDRRPGEPGYPPSPGPGTVEPPNNAPGFVPPAAEHQPPVAPAWNQAAQPPAAPQGPAPESWGQQPHRPSAESWGHQQHGGPHRHGQPSLDDVPLRRAKKAPGSGWRKAVHHMSGGAINPGMSAEELRLQELVARIRQPVRGDYRIAVLSLKGGVGKTTTTMGLGSIFASIRGDRVIAVDANPDFGTLSQRVPLQTRSTVRDLLLDPSIERYSDVRRHTSQATSRLEVLASERDPAASEAFNDEEYRAVARILQRYYNIILTDCGTGLMHSAMAGVLDLAHSLVLISSAAIDGARSAAATLDWLSLHGHDHLVRNAVVVINLPREGSPNVGVQQLREYFLSRCRAVHIIPYDSHLSEGAEIDLHRLSKQAKRAYVELAATVADEFGVDHRRFHT